MTQHPNAPSKDDAKAEKTSAPAAGTAPEAAPHPVARLYGEPLLEYPKDLYIPPDALEVFLERFEGPLDLLLWLIRSQKFDVMDIPMALLTEQYMAYVELIRRSNLELASAYLVMSATLMSIKSRMLLPKRPDAETGEEPEDPRAELMRRLLEYERMRAAAKDLDELPRLGRDFLEAGGVYCGPAEEVLPTVTAEELALAWETAVARLSLSAHHQVTREELSVREHMTAILKKLNGREFIRFTDLLKERPDEQSACVWFLATLELAKIFLISVQQAEPYGEIYLRPEDAPALVEDAPVDENAAEDELLTAEGERTEEELRSFWRRRLLPGEQGSLFDELEEDDE